MFVCVCVCSTHSLPSRPKTPQTAHRIHPVLHIVKLFSFVRVRGVSTKKNYLSFLVAIHLSPNHIDCASKRTRKISVSTLGTGEHKLVTHKRKQFPIIRVSAAISLRYYTNAYLCACPCLCEDCSACLLFVCRRHCGRPHWDHSSFLSLPLPKCQQQQSKYCVWVVEVMMKKQRRRRRR